MHLVGYFPGCITMHGFMNVNSNYLLVFLLKRIKVTSKAYGWVHHYVLHMYLVLNASQHQWLYALTLLRMSHCKS